VLFGISGLPLFGLYGCPPPGPGDPVTRVVAGAGSSLGSAASWPTARVAPTPARTLTTLAATAVVDLTESFMMIPLL